ncbi:S-adenosyl-L-methionine-dependent methyltransferase [Xylariomycetidae sp. FL0641]|nr:S-adenosyl-L-methionine-dependent methyltransferase [Xylariomycetidae sp. FL0641]
MSSGNDRFSAEAAAWDNNPFVNLMSDRAWACIQEHVPIFDRPADQRPNVLEIGCGTGLLSLQVAPRAACLVAVDAAGGMVDALKRKLARPGAPGNVVPVHALLSDPEDQHLPPANADADAGPGGRPRLKFDLVLSHLVLHHLPDLAPALRTVLGCLAAGTGRAALTDFEDFGPEARRFHPEAKMDGVARHGVRRAAVADLMREVGFVEVEVRVGWTASKTVERFPGEFGDNADATGAGQGEAMEFPFLICMGRRPGESER